MGGALGSASGEHYSNFGAGLLPVGKLVFSGKLNGCGKQQEG